MKLRKPISLLLSVSMLFGMTTFISNAATDNAESVSAGSYYNSSYLESYASNAYNEQNLGATYSATSTTWKTWSPDASSVKLNLYRTGSDTESGAGSLGSYNLTKNSSTGVWSTTLSGDYKNYYYTYSVTVNGSTKETQDVYSKAVGVNGNRSMVVDLASTNPDGWSTDQHVLFDDAAEAVVWEVHVRDFSASSTSGVTDTNKGKYLAFTEGGTKLNSSTDANAVSTGIDYLVEQGINCVQLMPVYDFQSVNEDSASSSDNRNWGYDPQNYNAPEGSYSSDPYDGNVRITEFKQMIQALHDRGISVVMDVVYNHTYSTDSCFQKTVPGYYYRMKSASSFADASGCGNETASDKLMFRKFMIDSITYWASEYHIDGFRFDLMKIHDITTMNNIRTALDNLYTDGSGKKILMYGEPWAASDPLITDGCTQAKASSLNSRVGMFNDAYRTAIKGGSDDNTKGFVQGTDCDHADIIQGVNGKSFSAQAPSQTIAYMDAHDNLIMWDKLCKSNSTSAYSLSPTSTLGAKIMSQVKNTFTLLLTSQGIPFATAGSEFCRTKLGDHNSYKSGDDINAIDWNRVSTYSNAAAYYKGLLEIRKNYTPMHDNVFDTVSVQSSYGYVSAFTYSNNRSNEWGKVCVLVNSGTQTYSISLGASGWTIVANGTTAGLKSLGTVSGSSYSIPAMSSAILVQSSTFSRLQNTDVSYGTLTTTHKTESGEILKTTTAKYRAGSTYRAIPDSEILYDYILTNTTGTATGTVVGGQNYNVTFTYKSNGIPSGYLTVKYVTSSGTQVKEPIVKKYRQGDKYDVPFVAVQGYQLDTTKYPAATKGVFDGNDKTITFTYKDLDSTTTTVHYYCTKWSSIQCYAYTDDGKEPNGIWQNATLMTSEGNNWYKCTISAPVVYVMFHPSTGDGQEPGQGEQGYLVSGDSRIQNGVVTFPSKIITSHIDINTGAQLSADVIIDKTVTGSDSYTTSALSGRDDVIVPFNASGSCAAGVTNVVYLYGETDAPIITTTNPVTTTTNPVETTTNPVETTTNPVETTAPVGRILIGDANEDGEISIIDATLIQKYIAELETLSDNAKIASDCDEDDYISVKDVTLIQKYLVNVSGSGKVGTYAGDEPITTQPITTQPVTTQPVTTQPTTTQPTTVSTNKTITFTNSLWWSGTISCYYWKSDDVTMSNWPGVAMTKSYTNDYYQDVYTITVPSDVEFVIFTDGNSSGNKTMDVELAKYPGLKYYATETKDSGGGYIIKEWT